MIKITFIIAKNIYLSIHYFSFSFSSTLSTILSIITEPPTSTPDAIILSKNLSTSFINFVYFFFNQFIIFLFDEVLATGAYFIRDYVFYTLYPLLSCLVIIRFIDIFLILKKYIIVSIALFIDYECLRH